MRTAWLLVGILISMTSASVAPSLARGQGAQMEVTRVLMEVRVAGCRVAADPARRRATILPSSPADTIPVRCFRAAMESMNVKSAVRLEYGTGLLRAETLRTASGARPLSRWRCVLGAEPSEENILRHPIECAWEPIR